MSAYELMNRHSIFGKVDRTVNLSSSLIRIEKKIDRIESSLKNLTRLVKLFNGILEFPYSFMYESCRRNLKN